MRRPDLRILLVPFLCLLAVSACAGEAGGNPDAGEATDSDPAGTDDAGTDTEETTDLPAPTVIDVGALACCPSLTVDGGTLVATLPALAAVRVVEFPRLRPGEASRRTLGEQWSSGLWSGKPMVTYLRGGPARVTQLSSSFMQAGFEVRPTLALISWSADGSEEILVDFRFEELFSASSEASGIAGAGAWDDEGRLVVGNLASEGYAPTGPDAGDGCTGQTTWLTVNRVGLDGTATRIFERAFTASEFSGCLTRPRTMSTLTDGVLTLLTGQVAALVMAQVDLAGNLVMAPTMVAALTDLGPEWVSFEWEAGMTTLGDRYAFVSRVASRLGLPDETTADAGEMTTEWWSVVVDGHGEVVAGPSNIGSDDRNVDFYSDWGDVSGLTWTGRWLAWCYQNHADRRVELLVLDAEGQPHGDPVVLAEVPAGDVGFCDTVAIAEDVVATAVHVGDGLFGETWMHYSRIAVPE